MPTQVKPAIMAQRTIRWLSNGQKPFLSSLISTSNPANKNKDEIPSAAKKLNVVS